MHRSLLSVLAALPLLTNAQQVSWMESWPVAYTMNPAMASQVLAQGPAGELLSVRQSIGAFNYGSDLFGETRVERLDPATGAVLLSCTLGDSVMVDAGAVDAAGNMYVAGRFMGDLLCCNAEVLGNTSPALWNVDLFLMAMAADGTVLWLRDLSVDHPDEGAVASLAIDPSGDLWYALSEFELSHVVRVDAQGHDVDTRDIAGVRALGTIDFDPWGGLYVAGAAEQNGLTFGGQHFAVDIGTGYKMFVLRFAPDGTAGFAQFASDVTFQRPTVVADDEGFAYLAGDLLDSTSWGGIPLNGPDWVFAMFIAKLDSTGAFFWAHETDPPGGTIEGDMRRSSGPCIAVDGASNVYLMGDTRGLVHWPNGVTSGGGTPPQDGATIVKFAPDGQALWAANTPDAMNSNSFTQTLTVDEMGIVHFAVHTSGAFTFGAITVNTDGGQDAVVGELNSTSTGVAADRLRTEEWSAWPNPANNALNVWCPAASGAQAQVIDSEGRLARTVRLLPGANTLELTGLVRGLYLLRTAEGGMVRFVKE
ncbi:MAG TPA: hypothetical protein VHL57_09150 [Flavobacteriales bacterium]|jgi:hypothetical protein|nr:hypothetical protein [Flavobacteriales bacterium]